MPGCLGKIKLLKNEVERKDHSPMPEKWKSRSLFFQKRCLTYNLILMHLKIITILLIFTFPIMFSSCDPYYLITVTNTTNDTTTILVKETVDFKTEKNKIRTTEDGFDVYQLEPKEQIMVGSAIAEIDNEIPFEVIIIAKNRDTILADNVEEIIDLFDRNIFGGLKTPYNISIK